MKSYSIEVAFEPLYKEGPQENFVKIQYIKYYIFNFFELFS